MAVGVIGAAADDRGATYNVDGQRLIIDMENELDLLEDSVAPLAKMLQHPDFGKRVAQATKIEWPSSEILPCVLTLGASYASTGSNTAVTFATGQGAYLRAHDLVRNELTGEIMQVLDFAGGADIPTLQRNIGPGGAGAASSGSTDTIVRLGNASAQGATMPTIKMTKTVFEWNWIQTQRDGVGVTNQLKQVKAYGGPVLDVERKKKMIEHYAAIERSLWANKRDLKSVGGTAVFGDANRAQLIMGGICGQFLTANIVPIGGALSQASLETQLRAAFRYGSGDKVAFGSALMFSILAGYGLGKSLINFQEASVFGVKAKQYITGAGDTLSLVLKRDWNDYPTTSPGFGGSIVILDLQQLKYATLNGRSTALLDNGGEGRQAPDADLYAEEWLTDFSLEMKFGGSQGGSGGGTHAWLRGITG